MTEPRPERRVADVDRHEAERVARNWQSVRTVLDALILAGIIGILGALFSSHDQIAKNATDTQVQFATIITQIANMQVSVAGVPELRDRVVQVKTIQDEILRRLDADEARGRHQ